MKLWTSGRIVDHRSASSSLASVSTSNGDYLMLTVCMQHGNATCLDPAPEG
jgi:hypothetical protein